ncbi:MAG: septal ring lytic transglycosylase RlpA family protein [Bacteroidaceae bacterium]|nr:septal ring lytic transglycosylase RlpA family protein [Bacteroidaceae bacterium]
MPKAQQTLQGVASYYSDKLHGRRTSSGELYHRDSLTCAHRTLPFGTLLRVRSIRNNKEVVVRVTDRGPFTPRFLIDLSRAAAKELGFLRAGICKVEVTVLPDSIPSKVPPKE